MKLDLFLHFIIFVNALYKCYNYQIYSSIRPAQQTSYNVLNSINKNGQKITRTPDGKIIITRMYTHYIPQQNHNNGNHRTYYWSSSKTQTPLFPNKRTINYNYGRPSYVPFTPQIQTTYGPRYTNIQPVSLPINHNKSTKPSLNQPQITPTKQPTYQPPITTTKNSSSSKTQTNNRHNSSPKKLQIKIMYTSYFNSYSKAQLLKVFNLIN